MNNKETDIFTITVIDNKYYLVEFKEDVELTLESFVQLVNFQKEISGKVMPVLILCPPSATTDNAVMKYASKQQNNPYTKADAYVISSTGQKILGNFYLKFNTPERPTKLFNDKANALKWLSEFF